MTMSATRLGAEPRGDERARNMATPVPRVSQRLGTLAIALVFWGGTLLYTIVFCALSLRQYHAYVPHALDLGNMTQALWNTMHGHPYKFQNMRAPINVEAFGTDTRLSFHVEPIIPFLAAIYAIWPHVETLLVMQTVAVASGAIAVRLLVRRRLGRGLAEIAFPLAYLLFPALEAANLYEFHPVAFSAPLLVWAFYLADTRRYALFAIAAIAAMGTKEEIGILVGLIGLWIAVRNGDRAFGVIVAVLGVTWSLLASLVIVPHFHAGASSYWARYLPPAMQGSGSITQADVRRFWLHHPGDVWSDLTGEAKLSYLHRLLYPSGYLALLSPLTLLTGIPSLLLVLLSYEPHMYGGLAHYSAELVPVTIVASIFGTEWLSTRVAPLLRIRASWAIAACSIYLIVAAGINHRANGLSPLSTGFNSPAVTPHDRLLDRALALIPANASVSAQDRLNPHLSDREQIYLFPDLDLGRVQYIALDATQTTASTLAPCDLGRLITGDQRTCNVRAGPVSRGPAGGPLFRSDALLPSKHWNIVFAQDGILLLKHRQRGELLHNTLPPAFYSFARPLASDTPPNRLVARFGSYLELEGYRLDRQEYANLRNADVVLTTWWKVLRTPPASSKLIHYLSDQRGALQIFNDDQQTTDWFQPGSWEPGEAFKVQSSQLTVTTNHSGTVDVDIGITTNDVQYQDIDYNEPVTLLSGHPPTAVVGNHRILRVTHIDAHL